MNQRLIAGILPEYDKITKKVGPYILPKRTRHTPPNTLVLDMDGTLTHSTCEILYKYDMKLEPGEGDDFYAVYVKHRPFVKEFLQEMSKFYELVLFTAAEVFLQKIIVKI